MRLKEDLSRKETILLHFVAFFPPYFIGATVAGNWLGDFSFGIFLILFIIGLWIWLDLINYIIRK